MKKLTYLKKNGIFKLSISYTKIINLRRDDIMAISLNNDTFEKQISSGVTLVDFWAEWCSPCRFQLPILEEVAEEIGTKAVVAKVNVDEELELAQQFGVQSIPTLILFKDGAPIDIMVGVQDKETLVGKITNAL